MILQQTLALFVDAYRELNAKKLFWICLALSGLVVAAFAGVTITETGLNLFGYNFDSEFNSTNIDKEWFYYNIIVVFVGIKIWLTWAAAILAIISTASIFPDFVSGGSIEAMLSKPIGRWRLFLTKYLTGLLFALAQVSVFAVACFVLIGLKSDVWEPKILLSIPLVTLFFSYLFCVCTLIGLITRSTIAAILLTILFWLMIFGLHFTESILLDFRTQREIRIERYESVVATLNRQVAGMEELLRDLPGEMSMSDARREIRIIIKDSMPDREELASKIARDLDEPPSDMEVDSPVGLIEARLQERREAAALIESHFDYWSSRGAGVVRAHKAVLAIKTILPKTSETTEMINRYVGASEFGDELADQAAPSDDQPAPFSINQTPPGMDTPPRSVRQMLYISPGEKVQAIRERIQSRPEWWVIGTSLGFEAFILLISGWYFARKDF